MRLPDDDELYEVDQTYLGPPGRYIAPMRHKAIFAWLVVAPMTLVILQRLNIELTLLTGGLCFLLTLWAAMKLADYAGAETPVSALGQTFWNELTAPRPLRVRHVAMAPSLHGITRPRGGWGRYLTKRRKQMKESDT
jgi:hypothetical protein